MIYASYFPPTISPAHSDHGPGALRPCSCGRLVRYNHNKECTKWFDVAWHGMAWNGMAWRGVAWHGMAWHGMAWHGYVDIVLCMMTMMIVIIIIVIIIINTLSIMEGTIPS